MTGRGQDLHEGDAVAGRRLLWLALGLGVLLAGVMVLGYVLWRHLAADIPRDALRLPSELPLQQHPRADLREHQRRHAQRMDGYAWLDREAGLVRIPIRRAMEIMAAQHDHAGGRAPAQGRKPGAAADPAVPAEARP